MFQFPKSEHTTLPSVENWYTSTNILRLPPKAVFTRRRDRVGEDLQITGWIDDSGDRICEGISKYARGINPMVSVSYSNYNAGSQSNPIAYSGNKEASLPYKAFDNGAFRPPILTQEDLLPLSRLPRNRTSVLASPQFPNYVKKMTGFDMVKKSVRSDPLHASGRPTTYFKVQKPLCEPAGTRDNVRDSVLNTSVGTNVYVGNITSQNVQTPIGCVLDDKTSVLANTNVGSSATTRRTIDYSHLNTDRWINEDPLHQAVSSGVTDTNRTERVVGQLSDRAINNDLIHQAVSSGVTDTNRTERVVGQVSDRAVKDEISNVSVVPNQRGIDQVVRFEWDKELDRNVPLHQMSSNVCDMTKAKNLSHENEIELQNKVVGIATVNKGSDGKGAVDVISSRDYKLPPSLQKEGFVNNGFVPASKQDYKNMIPNSNITSTKTDLKKFVANFHASRKA